MGAALSKWSWFPSKVTLPAPSELLFAFDSCEAWRHYYNSIKDSSRLVVVQFTYPYCYPSALMEPDVLRLASKYTKVQFIKMRDIYGEDVAEEYDLRGTPTFVLMKKGEEVDRVIGAMEEDLEKAVRKHRNPKLSHFFWPWHF